MRKKMMKFYNRNKVMVLILVAIAIIAIGIYYSDYTFSVFGGWSRKPI